jgi:hypothetical protein
LYEGVVPSFKVAASFEALWSITNWIVPKRHWSYDGGVFTILEVRIYPQK